MRTEIPKKGVTIILFAAMAILTCVFLVTGTPVGPSMSVLSNSTISSTPETMNDSGGYIYYSSITATQQNYGWKAYVGNVSGSYTLDDSSGYTIYDWTLNASLITGEIYASRNASLDWTYIRCANASTIDNETRYFGLVNSSSDSIGATYNWTNHSIMQTATSTMTKNTCYSTWLNVNDSKQTPATTDSDDAFFQQILLSDGDFDMIYATFIETDAYNYQSNNDKNITADFQIILPENKTKSDFQAYYFYVEI